MPTSKIVGHGMDSREKEKFDRVAGSLYATFSASGFPDVSDCRVLTVEAVRHLYFYRRTEKLPLTIIEHDEFMSGTDDELAALIACRMAEKKHSHQDGRPRNE